MKATTLRTFFLLLFSGALAACTPGTALGQVTTPLTNPATQAAPATTNGPQTAVQDVIQRGNAEQEQAVASGDSSVMADTSTSSYYQQLAQANRDLSYGGVTAITLVKLEWGPISIHGSSATATTYETWATTYSDGTTDQARDENDYALVQQNGAWKIQSDDHPNDGLIPAPASTTSPDPSQPTAPVVPAGNGQSRNWSGYTATGGKFTAVSGTWTVPDVTSSTAPGTDAAWVGIGGVNSHDLIQAGTQESSTGSGHSQYQAWVEMLPQYSQPVPLAVHPGDSVSVSIAQQSGSNWKIDFTNNTTGSKYSDAVQYDSSLSSAEWVEEAPSSGRGSVLPLDNFGTVTFSSTTAIENGKTVNLSQANARPITMINGGGQALVTTSKPSGNGDGFSVTRTATSSSVPASTGLGRGGRGSGRGSSTGVPGQGRQPVTIVLPF
jgi:hypothetical protein